ncbi:MAG: polysaccharide biosynthesis protein [Bradymonadales bacterium]|nr:polysaccharide biosynthesis protein [Bradymonadales bacterium]
MTRMLSRGIRHAIDMGILSIAFWLAFQIRFDLDMPEQYFKRALFLWPYVVTLQGASLFALGVHRFSWPYFGLRESVRLAFSLAASSLFLLGVRLVSGAFFNPGGPAQYVLIPIGVIAIDYALALVGILTARVATRLWWEHTRRVRVGIRGEPVDTLLIGAGEAGLMVAKEIAHWPGLGIRARGFVDDDPGKQGLVVHGLKVIGRTEELPALIRRLAIKQCIITIANVQGQDVRRISALCEAAGTAVKIIPGIFEILDGKVDLTRIREVSVEDLLRREVVRLESERVEEMVRNKVVLVTGAGGSIGSEICRQVAALGPGILLALDREESSLAAICQEIAAIRPSLCCPPLLADITDEQRMAAIFDQQHPQIVFHAAAHKHVPMVEWNPGEAIRNNVLGTRLLASQADRFEVERFVQISTDKAVNPSSIMGATKRVAELVVQAQTRQSKTRFVSVRFGNVLGSAGSVVPLFRRQIEAGGPVTVTHPEMRRYFMTIPEATQLVLQSAALGRSGDIFVLDMGEPVKIVDLARDLIRLSGFEPDRDIPISFSGIRPGEKLFEELGFDPATMAKTRHPQIFVMTEPVPSESEVSAMLAVLEPLQGCRDAEVVRQAFREILPEMQDADGRTDWASTGSEPQGGRHKTEGFQGGVGGNLPGAAP